MGDMCARVLAIGCELSYCYLVAKADHLVQEEIILYRQHLTADRMVSSEPDICLLCNRSIEEPSSAIWAHELGVIGRIAMLLAEFVADLVLVKEVEDIDGHSHVEKP
jgi:hypothetical protein